MPLQKVSTNRNLAQGHEEDRVEYVLAWQSGVPTIDRHGQVWTIARE